MKREDLDRAWEFFQGKPSAMPIPGLDRSSRVVNLPHDFMIETDTAPDAPGGALTGYYNGGIGTYTKILNIPKDYDDKRVLVEFDGSYMNTTVALNGHTVARHHYGYTPFHADLTPFMKPGKPNRLAVTVNNTAQPNARWYTGSGLYRHVDLLVAPKVHISPWGIYARTSHIVNDTAFIIVETTVENHTADTVDVWVKLQFELENSAAISGEGEVKIHIAAGGKGLGRILIPVQNAHLWDIDSPNLYKITAELKDQETVIDSESTLFGIRTISVDAINGFMLNGRTLKLKGGCVHHDNGILGAASFRDSEYRKMKLHKDNGYNAIRFAHNPMSRDLLSACDRLGLLVINEAFDVWVMEKSSHDYSQHFEQDWQKDLDAFILRDRNSPSVIMWSVGNEVPERGGLSNGYLWSAQLAARVRELDPTRPVTNAVCSFFSGLDDEDQDRFFKELFEQSQRGGDLINLDTEFGRSIWGDYTEALNAPMDVIGYNYLNYQFEDSISKFPNRIICSTESKPKEMDIYWEDVERFPHVIGDFTWTSYDYLGEAGIGKVNYTDPEHVTEVQRSIHLSPYPWRTAYDADFDLCGFPRPQLAYRRIIWGSAETYIASHYPRNYGRTEIMARWGWPEVENTWSWAGDEDKPVQVDVYSAAEEVELLLNGRILGRKPTGKGNRFTASFYLNYEPGSLEAKSYTAGQHISSSLLVSSGAAAGIRLVPEQQELFADGQSLSYVIVDIIDSSGRLVPTAECKATAVVQGAATLAAFGTGRPQTEENYTAGVFSAYKGRLLAIVRANYERGKATLTVNVDGLPSVSLEIPVVQVAKALSE